MTNNEVKKVLAVFMARKGNDFQFCTEPKEIKTFPLEYGELLEIQMKIQKEQGFDNIPVVINLIPLRG